MDLERPTGSMRVFAAGCHDGVTPVTAETARRLVELLPPGSGTPRVMPDGEGGVLFVWGEGAGALVVIVEDSRMHVIVHPTTAIAEYHEDLPFGVATHDLPPGLAGSAALSGALVSRTPPGSGPWFPSTVSR